MTTLVLLPGMDGTGELFGPLIAALNGQVRTLVVRYPTDEALSYLELQRLVHDLLPEGEPYFLLGEAFSGPVAISIAAEKPVGLQGVILGASFLRNPRPRLSPFEFIARTVPVAAIPSHVIAWALLGRHSTSSLRSMLSKALSQVPQRVWAKRLQEVVAVDVTSAARMVEVPALYLQAAEDRLVPGDAARLAEACIADSRTVLLQGPHMLFQAMPAESAQVIEQFMAWVANQGRAVRTGSLSK